MIENNLLKSNFLGMDGFRWWIGQVPPKDTWLLQWNKQPEAWGNRVKVRIMGYHPQNTTELKDEDLPWALVILSPQCGSGKAGRYKPIRIAQGDVVVGFFLDGDDGQIPVIFGVIGNSSYVVNGDPGPFTPFSGFTPDNSAEGNVIPENETGEDTQNAQNSPRLVDEELADKITESTGKDTKSASKGVGTDVAAGGSSDAEKISSNLENSVKDAKNASPSKKNKIISDTAKKINGVSQGITRDITKSAFNSLGKNLNTGNKNLYNTVYQQTLAATKNTAIAKKAGTAAITAMVPGVAALQNKIPCVVEKIAGNMLPDITSLLTSFLDNVVSFTPCIADQFTGALFNKVIESIGSDLAPELGGVGKIMGGFNLVNDLRGKAEGLLGLQELVDCVAPGGVDAGGNVFTIGKGIKNMPTISPESILSVANAAQALQEAAGAPGGILGGLLGQFDFLNPNVSTAGFSSVLGECYTGPPLDCKGIQVNVFGSDGQGTLAEPIIGSLVGDAFAQQTGSLIGIKLTNPGEGYTVPPLVSITDNCNQGYGAQAEAVIDYDPTSPTYQQVTDIYVIVPGENYPVIEENAGDGYIVDHVVVVDSGRGYTDDDTIVDNEGNEYVKFLDNDGRILNVIAPNPQTTNVIPVKDLPILRISSRTGSGAIIKAQIAPRPSYQGEIRQIIDCITPRDGIVGFVNGEPYYGPFHIHPTKGVKMVGVAHTTSAHAIIYDTPAESRQSMMTTTTDTTTNVSTQSVTYSSSVAGPTGTTTTQTSMTTPPPAGPSSPPSSPPPASPPASPPPSSPPPASPPPSSPPPSSPPGGYGGY